MATEEQAIIKFPREKNQYELITPVRSTNTSTIYKAKYVNPVTGVSVPVGIKIIDTCKIEDIYSTIGDIHEAKACEHSNIVRVHCSFKFDDQLWVIMTSLSRLSLRSVIRASFPNGLSETNIVFVLKQTLEALNHMHANNKLHGSLDAGCIFLDNESRVRIALSSFTHDENYLEKSLGGYPAWAVAPELMTDYRKMNGKETDVWMFGLLAVELFYGRIPASNFEEFQILMAAIENESKVAAKKKSSNRGFGGSSGFLLEKLRFVSCFTKQEKEKIPGPLGELMAACLCRDPRKRPTTSALMEYELFNKTSTRGEKSLAILKKAWK